MGGRREALETHKRGTGKVWGGDRKKIKGERNRRGEREIKKGKKERWIGKGRTEIVKMKKGKRGKRKVKVKCNRKRGQVRGEKERRNERGREKKQGGGQTGKGKGKSKEKIRKK